ncbi:MAG: murein L,D-transpeptidase catalytic domain family protein [Bacteroidia bacterium]|nr:murein L,D-transpeptidase catalytic domain family protein [Bacteroidia bacterium]
MGKTRTNIWRLLALFALIIAGLLIYSYPRSVLSPKVLEKKAQSRRLIPEKVDEILPFLEANHYSTELAILVDMSLSIHQKRMYIVNPQTKQILHSCLVAHGKGNQSSEDKVYFSNVPNSFCSSLGKYKIAERYTGRFGDSYRLDGLDSTNSKARKRAIVFHYYEHQSSSESIGPHYFSEGCPMLAEEDWRIVDEYIKVQDKRCILWIFS